MFRDKMIRILKRKYPHVLRVACILLILVLLVYNWYLSYSPHFRQTIKIHNDIKLETVVIKANVLNRGHQKKCTNLNLVILVTSHLNNTKQRNTIRSTWANKTLKQEYKNKLIGYEVYFLVGITMETRDDNVNDESKNYRDVIQVNRIENFYNLSSKLMDGLEWIHQNCEYKYLLKCDDDVFINVPAAVRFITDRNTPSSKLYTGFPVLHGKPFRGDVLAAYTRYVVTKEEYPLEIYPPYCAGGGFFLSSDVVSGITVKHDYKNPFKIDDVYIGILVKRTRLDVDMMLARPLLNMFWMYASDGIFCTFNHTQIVHHKVRTIQCMQHLYKNSLLT